MEWVSLLAGIVVIGYVIFLLILPFSVSALFRRIGELESKIRVLEDGEQRLRTALARLKSAPQDSLVSEAQPSEDAAQVAPSVEEEAGKPRPASEPPTPPKERLASTEGVAVSDPWLAPSRVSASGAAADGASPTLPALFDKLKTWLLGGNTVARVGVIVLFLGVAFLLKYASERGWLPIEMRLMATALGGIGLILIGWRLRTKRRNYGLVLQGGGTGIVYLTVFAAANMYQLVPAGPGLVLMVVLVALSSALAVLQDARSLAFLAAVGGFLGPVLLSRGGSHVALFAYYAVLDAGILAIAWFKPWRELNLVGFVFTFVIGSIWGYRYYQPEHFATTEPFLILFYLFYVAVPVLFAHRQPPNLKGYVDGSLIFGVPLVGFALQSTLVRDFEFGMALSALAAGVLYAVLATLLWRRRSEAMRMLTEAFVALAIAMGTVAIPLAVDGRWTGGAWALEGAALVWIGVRQRRLLARSFGLLVQLGAGIAFFTALDKPAADVAVLNSLYLGALMASLSGLFSAFYVYRHREMLLKHEQEFSLIALVWGLIWWFAAGGNEIWKYVEVDYRYNAGLLFVALSMLILGVLRRRLDWAQQIYPPMLLLPVMAATALVLFLKGLAPHPFRHGGLVVWVAAFAIQFWLLRRFESEWPRKLVRYGHMGTLWLGVFLLAWQAAWLMERVMPEALTWRYIAWSILPIAVVLGLPRLGAKLGWPIQRFKVTYLGFGLMPVVGFLALWALHASFQRGDPSPLSYAPILNPLELTQLVTLMTVLWWSWQGWVKVSDKFRWYGWSAVAFVVLNGIIARATHFWGRVSFEFSALWHAARYQASVSITWTVAALLIMVVATRLKARAAWAVGGVLLAAAVVKLFVVDLAGVGTVGRIVSFIVAGLLILLIGYLSPLPPKLKE